MSDATLCDHPEFRLKDVRGVLVVTLAGPKLSFDSRDALYRLVEVDGHSKLVLDFQNVRVMTSAPIGVLVTLKKKAELIGGSVVLCRLEPDLLAILEITRVAGLFVIFADEQAALDAVASQ